MSHLSLDDHEERILADALYRADGNQSAAARILKVSRDTVRYKIAKHGLKRK
jgi:DNA-binding protein Fis